MRVLQYVGTSDLMKNPRKSVWVENLASCMVRLNATEPLLAVLLEELEVISGYDKRNIAKTLASRPGFVRVKNSGRWYYMASFYNYAVTLGNDYYPSDFIPFIQAQIPREVVLDESDTLPTAAAKGATPAVTPALAYPTQVVPRAAEKPRRNTLPAAPQPSAQIIPRQAILASFEPSTFETLEDGGDEANPVGRVAVPVKKLRGDATGVGVLAELQELVAACTESAPPEELVESWQRLSQFAASLATHVAQKAGVASA